MRPPTGTIPRPCSRCLELDRRLEHHRRDDAVHGGAGPSRAAGDPGAARRTATPSSDACRRPRSSSSRASAASTWTASKRGAFDFLKKLRGSKKPGETGGAQQLADAAADPENPPLHSGPGAGRAGLFPHPAILAGRLGRKHRQSRALSRQPLRRRRACGAARQGEGPGAGRISRGWRLSSSACPVASATAPTPCPRPPPARARSACC